MSCVVVRKAASACHFTSRARGRYISRRVVLYSVGEMSCRGGESEGKKLNSFAVL